MPHVTAAAPGLYGQVLISRGARSGGALVKGVVPAEERTVGDLLQSVKSGSAAALEADPSQVPSPTPGAPALDANQATPPIVIGKDLAETLGAQVGDTVLVTSPQGELTPLGLVPRYQRFSVVGIFVSGFYQYDSSYTFTRLADAQRLFSEPDLISVISFKVDDLYRANVIGQEIEQAAGPGYQATSWMEQNRELFRALKLEQIVTFIVLALIVCVAALNILIALTMMVMEKTKDIAVMMSFGVTAAQVRRGVSAAGSADLRYWHADRPGGRIRGKLGGRTLPVHSARCLGVLDRLPAVCTARGDALIVAGVSLSVSLLATLYPSASAARVLPAEALRYE